MCSLGNHNYFVALSFVHQHHSPSLPVPPHATTDCNYIAYLSVGKNRHSMRPTTSILLRRWHRMLGLPNQSPPSWYRDRLREELSERRAATTRWQRLSETSDVVFSISRALHDGFPVGRLPPIYRWRNFPVYLYMVAKYTLRWAFYRVLARLCRAPRYDLVCEVINPNKDHKLEEVAFRHHIDLVAFKDVGGRLRRFWPFLP
jgi:hypothetical protein